MWSKNASYRRTVYTGKSYRTTVTSRGNAYSSASAHFGERSVCAKCALDIDYKAKRNVSIGTLIVLLIITIAGFLFFGLYLGLKKGMMDRAIVFSTCWFIGIIIISSNLKSKAKKNADLWYLTNKSRYIGDTTPKSTSDNTEQSTLVTSNVSEKKWKCNSCGYSENLIDDFCCKNCHSTRYTYETLPEEEKRVATEYANKVLALQTFDDILKMQKIFFFTTGISFLAFLFPDVNKFSDLDSYKANIKKILGEVTTNIEPESNEHNTQQNTATEQSTAIKSMLSTISERIQQEMKILDTKYEYIKSTYNKLILYTTDDCNKTLTDLNDFEKDIEQAKKTMTKFCDDYIKQLSKTVFEKDALSYSKNYIENTKLVFTDYTNQIINQLKNTENQVLQAKIKIMEQEKTE